MKWKKYKFIKRTNLNQVLPQQILRIQNDNGLQE